MLQKNIIYLFIAYIFIYDSFYVQAMEISNKVENLKKIKASIADIRNLKNEIKAFQIKLTNSDLAGEEESFQKFNKKLHKLSINCIEAIDDTYQEMDEAENNEDELEKIAREASISYQFFLDEYQEIKDEIELANAQQAQKNAQTKIALEQAEKLEQEGRKKLEEDYENEFEELINWANKTAEEIDARDRDITQKQQELAQAQTSQAKAVVQKEIEASQADLQQMQDEQERLEKQKKDIALQLSALESESLSKEFMEYVAKNASIWLKSLPKDKIITQDVVRKVLGEKFTKSQVSYSEGFLQEIKA